MPWKCCTQYASKFGKLVSGHRTGKGQFSVAFQKGNAKECSNYCTIALTSHASKVMPKILLVRLQQYMNWEFPDVQSGFRKGRGTRDQIASIYWIIEKTREFQKNILVQSLRCVRLFVTPWIAAHQASLSITNSRSSHKLMSIESVMPSNHLIFCRPLLLLPPIPPSKRVFSNESALRTRWPKYWSFSIYFCFIDYTKAFDCMDHNKLWKI